MSYPPSSTTAQPPNPPNHANSTDSNGASSSIPQSQNHAVSPLDWANFMNFQTPPALHTGRSYGNMGQGGDNRGDQYTAFAQGIAMSRPSTQNINFSHPYPPASPSRNTQQPPQQAAYVPAPSPLQRHMQLPQQNASHRSPSSGPSPTDQPSSNKGKAVSRPPPNPTPQTISQSVDVNNPDNGLTLDPSAFTRDIRFQVPPFLTNQMGGAPTFPPGGEAWSGFSGTNCFSGDGAAQGQLTPGQLFGSSFDNQQAFQSNDNGRNGNVLDGLSGFGAGDGAWDNWNHGDQKESSGMGTTFYVNPNPAANVLAPRNQRPRTPGQARVSLPQPNTTQYMGNNVPASPRKPMGNPSPGQTGQKRPSTLPSPRPAISSGTMQTSAILPQPGFPSNNLTSTSGITFPFIPATNQNNAAPINIASSSTAPYAPPSNTQALLQGPGVIGPSLADGPGLYSTTGFDMVGVLSRVAARKDPKTVLGPVDLSCSFLVVVGSTSNGSRVSDEFRIFGDTTRRSSMRVRRFRH